MGSIKIIIFIIIIVIGIVKTVMGDAKKDKQRQRPAAPLPSVDFESAYESTPSRGPVAPPKMDLPQEGGTMPSYRQAEGVSSIPNATSLGEIEERNEMTEAERIAHAERWRQALIDSEILKRKF